MGTKLICDECRAQVIVTKSGTGTVMCHGVAMHVAGSAAAPRPAGAAQEAQDPKGRE